MSAYYLEVDSIDGAQAILDGFLGVVGTNFLLDDQDTTATRPWTNGVHKVGINYFGALMSINVDGVWSADVAYNGTLLAGALDLFRAGGFPAKIRELQRYDIASYQDGKDMLDGLMA